MGKSQRYQAAVDGHLCRHGPLERSEKGHGKEASRAGIRALCFHRQTLGDGLAALLLYKKPPEWGLFFLDREGSCETRRIF